MRYCYVVKRMVLISYLLHKVYDAGWWNCMLGNAGSFHKWWNWSQLTHYTDHMIKNKASWSYKSEWNWYQVIKSLWSNHSNKQDCLSAFNTDATSTLNYSRCRKNINSFIILFHYNVVILPQTKQRYTNFWELLHQKSLLFLTRTQKLLQSRCCVYLLKAFPVMCVRLTTQICPSFLSGKWQQNVGKTCTGML